jgi:hypothetical protein
MALTGAKSMPQSSASADLQYTWDDDPERGRRAIAEAAISGRRCIVVLYPVDDPMGDTYALGSAYPR